LWHEKLLQIGKKKGGLKITGKEETWAMTPGRHKNGAKETFRTIRSTGGGGGKEGSRANTCYEKKEDQT